MKSLCNFLIKKTKVFLKNKGGASAVEFALILPVMVVIYMSTVEISLAIAAQRRVAIAAGTVGDLAAQYETMNNDNISLILGSSLAVLKPYDPDTMTTQVSSVVIDDGGTASVEWGYKKQRSGHTDGDPVADTSQSIADAVPADLKVANTSVIVASINYTYVSPVGALLQGERPFTQTVYFRPRLGSKILFESSTPSQTWPLSTSGDDGSQISPTYIGFGTEYSIPVRTVDRTNNGSNSHDVPPSELQDAQACDWAQPSCPPGGGGTEDLGGSGCMAFEHINEIYMAPITCYAMPRRETPSL